MERFLLFCTDEATSSGLKEAKTRADGQAETITYITQTVSTLADCMQDGAGTLREQLCKSDAVILILTQTHTPTRASEDSKRSSRTSNTSEIKPSFRCWDHQVTSQKVKLEKQCPPPPTSVESSSGCDKAEGSAAFCVWRSSQESCDKHTLPHKHTLQRMEV